MQDLPTHIISLFHALRESGDGAEPLAQLALAGERLIAFGTFLTQQGSADGANVDISKAAWGPALVALRSGAGHLLRADELAVAALCPAQSPPSPEGPGLPMPDVGEILENFEERKNSSSASSSEEDADADDQGPPPLITAPAPQPVKRKRSSQGKKKKKKLAPKKKKARTGAKVKVGADGKRRYDESKYKSFIVPKDFECALECGRWKDGKLPKRIRNHPDPLPKDWDKDAEGNKLSEEELGAKLICDACYQKLGRIRRAKAKAEKEKAREEQARQAAINKEAAVRAETLLAMKELGDGSE